MNSLAAHTVGLAASSDVTPARAKCVLAGLGCLRVAGDDARDFLHGQFTADLKRLKPGRAGLAAWCNPKGRVLFLLDVLNAGDEGWLLLAPASEIAALAKRLRMFVLRAKVTIEDLGEHVGAFGLAGAALPAALDEVGHATRAGGAWLWRITADPALAYALGPQDAVIALWDEMDAPVATAARWEAFEIDARRPRIAAPLGERFLPQELDLERLQGVHFDKGCYPGQEIVARLKYRGQVKRGLHRAHVTGDVALGDRLYRDDATATVGDVLRVSPRADGSSDLLLVLDFDAVGSTVHLRDPQGPPVLLDP